MYKIQALKTGISLLWKAPKGKINPKALGYVCPDGAINFATEEAAVQYAKNKCVKAAKNGYEHGGLRYKNRIILEKIGDENGVDFGRVKINIPKGTEIFHDHPGEKANPISLQDYYCLMNMNDSSVSRILNLLKPQKHMKKRQKQ